MEDQTVMSSVLAGNGHGDMAFEVEMFLPADPHPAGEAARRKLQFGLSIRPRDKVSGLVTTSAPFSRASRISV